MTDKYTPRNMMIEELKYQIFEEENKVRELQFQIKECHGRIDGYNMLIQRLENGMVEGL